MDKYKETPGKMTSFPEVLGRLITARHKGTDEAFKGSDTVIEIPSEGHWIMSDVEAPTTQEIDDFFAREPAVPEPDETE